MAGLNDTPSGNRIRISFFGLRNAGKSTLVNEFTGQDVSIVSAVPGTTTDPVSKAMEILPLGPCLVTDTAGLDDLGQLGEQRVLRTLGVLAATDIAIWVTAGDDPQGEWYERFVAECGRNRVEMLVFRRGDSVDALRVKVASLKVTDGAPSLLDGLVSPGMVVVCVCPIDDSAPKGRLILPQVQVIRECLDRHVQCRVCQVAELEESLTSGALVIVDSQAFGEVRNALRKHGDESVSLTSFSILFARQKGDLAAYVRGLEAVRSLRDGDLVLIAEGCTHHRQCGDIGSVKIPKALEKLSGKSLRYCFSSGGDFDTVGGETPRMVVHCGGCMITRREMQRRIAIVGERGIPIVNYGMVLAAATGIELDGCSCRVKI